jgi:hypothetical protein
MRNRLVIFMVAFIVSACANTGRGCKPYPELSDILKKDALAIVNDHVRYCDEPVRMH